MKKFNVNELTPELLSEIKSCKSKEDFIRTLEAHNISVEEKELDNIKKIVTGIADLSEDQLDAISGGSCGDKSNQPATEPQEIISEGL